MDLQILIGEAVCLDSLRLDCWRYTTKLSYFGDLNCRRRFHSQQLKQNIMLLLKFEMNYLSNLLHNMGFPQDDDTPVYEDNTACIEWGNHIIGGRERAKHIDIRKHFAQPPHTTT